MKHGLDPGNMKCVVWTKLSPFHVGKVSVSPKDKKDMKHPPVLTVKTWIGKALGKAYQNKRHGDDTPSG